MAIHAATPVVKLMPRIVVMAVVYGMFVVGVALLWNDRRLTRVRDKTIAVPVFK